MATKQSMFEPAWQRLKSDLKIRIELQMPDEATTEDKEHSFLKVRRGISKRKDQDTQFRRDNPSAKIYVVTKDYANNVITLELRHINTALTLVDLTGL